MSLSIMRRFTFCAGHRLVGHEGKCQNLHGHNYVVEVFVTGQEQDEIGRILDFKMLKNRVNDWINENWDHTFILWEKDENGLAAIRSSEPHRVYELDCNPTAENMALHLLNRDLPKDPGRHGSFGLQDSFMGKRRDVCGSGALVAERTLRCWSSAF